ncbi:DUF2971 domain-containing protein [Pseudorhodoferax sp. Leaf267]|uniref:DUF2971 domain-containing protein n=1 Tax=Pseudorhodoferax sp. Leaf267 TaxID=1736316 RepID=UPI0009E949B4|nr:DUF2971 domain-containing protein [Pseudorhodoferax sp. Leaf267]
MSKPFDIKDCQFGFIRAQFDASYRFKGGDWDSFEYRGSQLVHYTNLKGLAGIVESGGFWLSDSRFLNDSDEYLNGSKLAIDLLLNIKSRPRYKNFENVLRSVIEKLKKPAKETYFVCSFTDLPDSLEQWRGYGNGPDAAAIVFNLEGIGRKTFTAMPIMAPQKVIYNDSVKKLKLLRVIAKFSIEFRKDIFFKYQIDEDDWAEALANALAGEFIIFKGEEFSAEQEIRLVAVASHLHHFEGIKHRVGGNSIIPYVNTADLRRSNNATEEGKEKLPIVEIRIGPNANRAVTLLSTKIFMENCGYQGVTIKPSASTYRS